MSSPTEPASRRPVDGIVQLLFAAFVVAGAIEQLRFRWRRTGGSVTSWWAGVEHRNQRSLRMIELGWLIRHAGVRPGRAPRPARSPHVAH